MQQQIIEVLKNEIAATSKTAVAGRVLLSRPTIDAILAGTPPNLKTAENILDRLQYRYVLKISKK